MLGIDDPFVLLAYVLCIVSSALCVAYGLLNWNQGDEPVAPADVQWAVQEDQVEKDL